MAAHYLCFVVGGCGDAVGAVEAALRGGAGRAVTVIADDGTSVHRTAKRAAAAVARGPVVVAGLAARFASGRRAIAAAARAAAPHCVAAAVVADGSAVGAGEGLDGAHRAGPPPRRPAAPATRALLLRAADAADPVVAAAAALWRLAAEPGRPAPIAVVAGAPAAAALRRLEVGGAVVVAAEVADARGLARVCAALGVAAAESRFITTRRCEMEAWAVECGVPSILIGGDATPPTAPPEGPSLGMVGDADGVASLALPPGVWAHGAVADPSCGLPAGSWPPAAPPPPAYAPRPVQLDAAALPAHFAGRKRRRPERPGGRAAQGAGRPNAPRRPPTAFFLFAAEHRAAAARDVGPRPALVARELGRRWQLQDGPPRAAYLRRAAALREGYAADCAAYAETEEGRLAARRAAARPPPPPPPPPDEPREPRGAAPGGPAAAADDLGGTQLVFAQGGWHREAGGGGWVCDWDSDGGSDGGSDGAGERRLPRLGTAANLGAAAHAATQAETLGGLSGLSGRRSTGGPPADPRGDCDAAGPPRE